MFLLFYSFCCVFIRLAKKLQERYETFVRSFVCTARPFSGVNDINIYIQFRWLKTERMALDDYRAFFFILCERIILKNSFNWKQCDWFSHNTNKINTPNIHCRNNYSALNYWRKKNMKEISNSFCMDRISSNWIAIQSDTKHLDISC